MPTRTPTNNQRGHCSKAVAAFHEPKSDKEISALVAKQYKKLEAAVKQVVSLEGTHRPPEESFVLELDNSQIRRVTDSLKSLSYTSLPKPNQLDNFDDTYYGGELANLRNQAQYLLNDFYYVAKPVCGGEEPEAFFASLDPSTVRDLKELAREPDNWLDREVLFALDLYNKLFAVVREADALKAKVVKSLKAVDADAEQVETLYHASLFAADILKHGFKAERPLERTGVGSLGTQQEISFTTSLRYARQLYQFFVAAWQLANGVVSLDRANALFKGSFHEARYDLARKRDLSGAPMQKEEWANEKKRTVHSEREFQRFVHMHEVDVNYLSIFDLKKLYTQLRSIPLESIGVLACTVDLSTAEHLPGEFEYRVLPREVLKVNKIVTTQSKGKATAAQSNRVLFKLQATKPQPPQRMQAVARKGPTVLHLSAIPKEIRGKYKEIGRGATSVVYELPNDQVLMVSLDPIKRDWLNHLGYDISSEHHEQLHGKEVSVLRGKPVDMPYELYAYKLPRLYPLPLPKRKAFALRVEKLQADLNNTTRKNIRSGMPKSAAMQMAMDAERVRLEEHKESEFDELLHDLLDFVSNYGMDQFKFDLHGKNIMQEANGDYVLLDPLIDPELLEILWK